MLELGKHMGKQSLELSEAALHYVGRVLTPSLLHYYFPLSSLWGQKYSYIFLKTCFWLVLSLSNKLHEECSVFLVSSNVNILQTHRVIIKPRKLTLIQVEFHQFPSPVFFFCFSISSSILHCTWLLILSLLKSVREYDRLSKSFITLTLLKDNRYFVEYL